MPTYATRKGGCGQVIIRRSCSPNLYKRRFHQEKLRKILNLMCKQGALSEVEQAIEKAFEQDCDTEERRKRKQQEKQARDQIQLDTANAAQRVELALAALAAAVAAAACLDGHDKRAIQEALDENIAASDLFEKVVEPLADGTIFTTGGGFGWGGFSTGGGF